MADDNKRARQIGMALQTCEYVAHLHPVDTNIVIAELQNIDPEVFLEVLAHKQILALPFGGNQVRMVTHLGITDAMVDQVQQALQDFKI